MLRPLHCRPTAFRSCAVVSLLAFVLLSGSALALTTGALSGQVTDPQGDPVAGARVTLPGVGAVATNSAGRYRIANVPTGVQTVTVSYLGLQDTTATAEVAAGTDTTLDVALKSDVVELEALVVSAFAEGQARSINQQRTANTIMNIISADKLGDLPDASVGEALSRVPGIGLQFDRGEAEFITVRGAAPKFNAVSLNGDRLPSFFSPVAGGADDRAVRLDILPTDLISRIEVTKAITPDLDADSVGGAVNLQTKSSLDYNRRVLTGKVQWGYNDMDSQDQYAGNFTYGQGFGALGLLVNGAFQRNNRPVQAVNPEYRPITTIAGVAYDSVLDQIDLRHRLTVRERRGGSVQLDFQTSPKARHYVRAFRNEFIDEEERRRFRVRFGSGGVYLPGTDNLTGIVDGGRLVHQDRDSTNTRNIQQFGLGGDVNFSRFDLNYSVAYTHVDAFLDRFETTWENRRPVNGVVDYTYDRRDVNFPRFTDPLGSVASKSDFVLASNRGVHLLRGDRFDEDDLALGLNLKFPARFGAHSGHWKVGARFRGKERDARNHVERWRPIAGRTQSLGDFLDDSDPTVVGVYAFGSTMNRPRFQEFFLANRGTIFERSAGDQLTDATQNANLTYRVAEDILAAYGLASVDVGQLNLVTGVRAEQTRTDYTNTIVTTPAGGGRIFTPNRASDDYTNVFPSVVGTYRVTERFLLRAAWTNTIARPDYAALLPRQTVDDQNNTIVEGNPALKPLESMNFDFSLEWYLPSAGLVSAGVYHKELKNFQFFQSSVIQFDAGTGPENFTLTKPFNGPGGSLTGLELSWQQRLHFLPGFLKDFGVTANYNLVSGRAEVPGRGNLDFLPDQVETVFNFILDYDRGNFSARVAYNYNGVAQNTYAEVALEDQFTDQTESFDASLGLKLGKGWHLFVDAKNLTDTGKKRFYLGRRDRPIEQEYTGYSVIGGLKFDF